MCRETFKTFTSDTQNSTCLTVRIGDSLEIREVNSRSISSSARSSAWPRRPCATDREQQRKREWAPFKNRACIILASVARSRALLILLSVRGKKSFSPMIQRGRQETRGKKRTTDKERTNERDETKRVRTEGLNSDARDTSENYSRRISLEHPVL